MEESARLTAITQCSACARDTPLWDATRALGQIEFDAPDFDLEDMAIMARLHYTGMRLDDIAWVFGVDKLEVRAMILLYAHAELHRRKTVAKATDTP